MSTSFPLNEKAEVREVTCSFGFFASTFSSSSVNPSEKYSCSLSVLRFVNGKTAIAVLLVAATGAVAFGCSRLKREEMHAASSTTIIAAIAIHSLRSVVAGGSQTAASLRAGRPHCMRRCIAFQSLQIGAHFRCALITQIAILLHCLIMMRSSSAGTFEFNRTGATGSFVKIASSISPVV